MPGISTTYLLPAIILNPAFILHLINTFFSHLIPPPPTTSYSPHPFMESLGPLPGTKLTLDMHANDQLCWGYTAIMVIAQLFAFGKVSDNRIARKAVRVERERIRKEKLDKLAETKAPTTNGYMSGTDGANEVAGLELNGNGHTNGKAVSGTADKENAIDIYGEESMTETSEEEMMI